MSGVIPSLSSLYAFMALTGNTLLFLFTAVGRGTTLQAGRSWVRFPMVSFEFFIDIILLTAL